jgi:hypothetical protein
MLVQGRSDDKHYGAAAVGAPREKDIEMCKALGKKVANLVTKLEKQKTSPSHK